MKTKVERVFTVEIQATQDVDGRIWQALRPAENCTLDKAGSANDAWYVAKEVAFTQTAAKGDTWWRVSVWVGADADTSTEPAAEVYSEDVQWMIR